jgi:large subunit ribosomal protein L9
MKSVEVLLRENLPKLGRCGDVVKVRSGFARNYLFPRRLAIQATPDNKKAMERRRLRLDAEEAERAAEIETRLLVLQAVKLETREKADESGRLYGSVGSAKIAALLQAQGKRVEEADVRLEAPIKTIGMHPVRVHVHGERYAELSIDVQREP